MLFNRKCALLLCLVLATFQFQLFAKDSTEERAHRVLFLSSYHLSFPTCYYQLEGVLSLKRLQADFESVDIDVEYMNTKLFPIEDRFPYVYKNLKDKVETMGNYDVIISADDNALHFLSEYKNELFGEDIPVVFFGINDLGFAEEMALKSTYTGIVESTSILDTVNLAFTVFPDVKTLHVIVDSTTSGQSDLKHFKDSIPESIQKKCEINSLSDLSYSDLADILEHFNEEDAVLLLSAYSDRDGEYKNFRQALIWLKEHVNRPVFHPYRHGVGDGLIGGRVVSHEKMAKMAVSYAQRILHGVPPENLELIRDSANVYLFDYKQLMRFEADFSPLQEQDVYFVNRPPTIYERHQKAFIVFILIFIVLVIFTLILSFLFVKQRQTLLELEESEGRSKSLFDNSFTPMLIVDPVNGDIVDGNPAAVKFYGYSYRDLVSLHICDINSLGLDALKEKMRLVEFGDDYKFQFQHKLANGEVKDVDVLTTMVYRKKRPLLFSIVQDNTERKAWENEIIEAKNRAIEVNKHKDEFLAMMSHEMRTPLNPILGFTSLLLDIEKDEESIRYLDLIHKSADHMLRLVDNILNYSKLRGGLFTPFLTDFCFLDFVNEAIEGYKEFSRGNVISFTNGIDGYEPIKEDLFVHTDRNMIHQILDNLVINSCKYTNNGSVRIFCAIEPFRKETSEGIVRFEIHDNGIGISEEMRRRLFQPFTQEDSSFTREYEGAGLGLAITQEIVKKLGGEIGLSSELGKGATFWFQIPLKILESKDFVSSNKEDCAIASEKAKQNKILVVEDNADNAEFIKATIRPYSINIEIAQNGQEGVDMASFNQYDLILMDLSMPLMDGITATKHIRAIPTYKSTPIVVFTANATEIAKQNAYQAGVNDILVKPLSPNTLSEKLLSYLR